MKKLHGLSGKFAVVAALTTVTMFGTGYAAWNFSQTATNTTTQNHVITDRDPKGALTVTEFLNDTTSVKTFTDDDNTNNKVVFYVVLDQSDLYFSASNDITIDKSTNTSNTTENCYSSKFNKIKFKYVGSGSATQEQIKLSTAITYSTGTGGKSYTDYLTFNPETAEETKDYAGSGSSLEFTYTMPTISWKVTDETNNTTAKPLTKTAYDNMSAALTGASITFTFTASVVA
jgi:hypothetical protein